MGLRDQELQETNGFYRQTQAFPKHNISFQARSNDWNQNIESQESQESIATYKQQLEHWRVFKISVRFL